MRKCLLLWIMLIVCGFSMASVSAEPRTWDGAHSIEKIEVRVVYFVPQDREPLYDWKARASYYCRRIEQFHQREYGGQSKLKTILEPTPFLSERKTQQLRQGDANAIFYKTLREVDEKLQFAQEESDAFPILLVLSEINRRPLDDFYRLKPGSNGLEFEGNYTNQQHFPGATSGGARATYLSREGKGWGLVSADGWRVPYRGSDCVVYHEGVGHTVGLPHPEPGNGSVMSLGQYRGWISESWLDKEQKLRMGWDPTLEPETDPELNLFSQFKALPSPLVPQPGEQVSLKFSWPDEEFQIEKLQVHYQTALESPWTSVENNGKARGDQPVAEIPLETFDRPTPVSYRVDVTLSDGRQAEIWGYFQVRESPDQFVRPKSTSVDLLFSESEKPVLMGEEIDLLQKVDPEAVWKKGNWSKDEAGRLMSPKEYGARIELPGEVPAEYRLVVIAEPLGPPNGLLLGSKLENNRFVALFNYNSGEQESSAIENINGRNVGNETTFRGNLFQQNRLSQIVLTIRKGKVTGTVDGQTILDWSGKAEELSLSDYWKTPDDNSLFLGAYDCHYRFHRISLYPIESQSE